MVYEEKLEEKSVVLCEAQDTRLINVKQITEKIIISKSENSLETSKHLSIVPAYRPALHEVTDIIKDVEKFNPELPMSLEKTILSSSASEKKEARAKRDAAKVLTNNFYDVDEYRADIYNYLRKAEVRIIIILIILCVI